MFESNFLEMINQRIDEDGETLPSVFFFHCSCEKHCLFRKYHFEMKVAFCSHCSYTSSIMTNAYFPFVEARSIFVLIKRTKPEYQEESVLFLDRTCKKFYITL